MKPQTKINILVSIETTALVGGTTIFAALYLAGSPISFFPIIVAVGVSLLLGLYISKRVLKLTWKEILVRFNKTV